MKNKVLYILLGSCITLALMFLYQRFTTHGMHTYSDSSQHDMHSQMHSTQTNKHDGDHATHKHTDPIQEMLIDRIIKGGIVLLVRHDRTDINVANDIEPLNYKDCNSQRNLSLAGKENSKEVNASLKKLNIQVSQVFTSPYCRNVDTANLMFGKSEVVEILSGKKISTDIFDMLKAGEYLKEYVNNIIINDDKNVAVVTHWGNVKVAYNVHLNEGDMAVLEKKNDVYNVAGVISTASFNDYIHDKMRAGLLK